MRHPMVGWLAWARRVDDAASDGWLVGLGKAGRRWSIPCLVGLLGQRSRRPDRRPSKLLRRAKIAAAGRQKGAPGDPLVFRIIIRLENAPELSNTGRGMGPTAVGHNRKEHRPVEIQRLSRAPAADVSRSGATPHRSFKRRLDAITCDSGDRPAADPDGAVRRDR